MICRYASLTPIQWLISVEFFRSCYLDRTYTYRKIQIKRKFRRWIFVKKICFNGNESDECHHWPSLVKTIFSWFLIKSKLGMTWVFWVILHAFTDFWMLRKRKRMSPMVLDVNKQFTRINCELTINKYMIFY